MSQAVLDAPESVVESKPLGNPHVTWTLKILFSIITVAVILSAGWRVSGGTLYSIQTPSMCPQVCVGALVLDRPVPTNFVPVVGETVTFTPPGIHEVYTHRVVQVFANGQFKTEGDAANIVDPWTVSPSDVRGLTMGTIWGLGWLSEALPFLAMGMLAIILMRRYIDVSVRRDWDRLFATLIVLIPVWLLKPLIRGVVVASSNVRKGVDRVTIVNTGLLPAQFRAVKGDFRDFISSGHRTTMTGAVDKFGQIRVSEFASFHWQGWTVIILIILSPLVGYGFRYRRLKEIDEANTASKVNATTIDQTDLLGSN